MVVVETAQLLAEDLVVALELRGVEQALARGVESAEVFSKPRHPRRLHVAGVRVDDDAEPAVVDGSPDSAGRLEVEEAGLVAASSMSVTAALEPAEDAV